MSRLPLGEAELAAPAGPGEAEFPAAGPSRAGEGDVGGSPFDQVGVLFLALLVALTVRTCAVEPFRIPSESMLPTLLIGDHLFVNKVVYGAPVPFTGRRLPALREPERGEVVVFTVARSGSRIVPADRRPDLPTERFVKRIVGLPGDRIRLAGGRVTVNGTALEQRELGETLRDTERRSLDLRAEGDAGRQWQVVDDPAIGPSPSPEFVVPAGRYFVLGDNRDHSNDSRSWGTVHRDDLEGPAFLLYWSWAFEGGWSELLRPTTWWELLTERMRWERVGAKVR